MTLRRSHDCVRCGTSIDPGEEFGAVDVLDPVGELQVLVCVDCAADLRAFLDGTTNRKPGDSSGSGDPAD
ncbi:hypothetical protein [Halopenitus malekzadehii]|uniref:hypothetical protein n=1 Tax=Halopenitus malekzadehii TaxID=1267564 RepID=UPI000B80EDA6|nr:hypothetical protein [Halopenitus malekzadehii]